MGFRDKRIGHLLALSKSLHRGLSFNYKMRIIPHTSKMSEAYSREPRTELAIQQPRLSHKSTIPFSSAGTMGIMLWGTWDTVTQVECLTTTGLNTSVLSPNIAFFTLTRVRVQLLSGWATSNPNLNFIIELSLHTHIFINGSTSLTAKTNLT